MGGGLGAWKRGKGEGMERDTKHTHREAQNVGKQTLAFLAGAASAATGRKERAEAVQECMYVRVCVCVRVCVRLSV